MDTTDLLWEDVTFFLLSGVLDAPRVLDALGLEARRVAVRPRRFALAETLQRGDENGPSTEDLAFFVYGGLTWIAPPSMAFSATGALTLPEALSRAFGICHVFTTTVGAPSIIELRDGELVAEVSELRVHPASGAFGLSQRIGSCADVLVALERHAGASLREIFGAGESEHWKLASPLR